MASVGDRSENSMDKKILQPGAVISCKTQLGEEFSGEVMAFDEDSKALVISIFSRIFGDWNVLPNYVLASQLSLVLSINQVWQNCHCYRTANDFHLFFQLLS